MRGAAGRLVTLGKGRLRRPHDLVVLGVLVAILLPGLALTAISPSAWPIPAVAAVGVLLLLVKATVAPARHGSERDPVAAEAANGVTQIEAWLSQRHHT